MSAKKGQTFNQYSEETKKEAVRLRWKKVGHTVGSWRSLVLRVRARLLLGYGKAKMERVLRISRTLDEEAF